MAEQHERAAGKSDDPRTNDSQTLLASVSNEMVRLYKDQFGRGPTKARTHWAGPDILVVALEDTLSPPSAIWSRSANINASATCVCSSNTRRSPSFASRWSA